MNNIARAVLGWSFLVLLSCQAPLAGQAKERPPSSAMLFVQDGAPLNIYETGKKWTQGEGYLECEGIHNSLTAPTGLGAGDFHIHARLTLLKWDSTGTSFFLNTDHFGFDDRKRQFYLEGERFGRPRGVGSAEERITLEKAFDLDVIRKGKSLHFQINGDEVTSLEYHAGPVGLFGFHPCRGTLRIHDFHVKEGAIETPPPLQTLFESGQDGYHTYRIPALLVTQKGTVLAFCEGRKKGRSDSGDIDLLMKRSVDQGKSWSPQQVIWDDGAHVCGNPCIVQDRDTGVLWLLMTWNRGDDHERAIVDGTSIDTRRVFITSSKDDGLTWAEPKEITDTVKKPTWSWYATGPGVGIQMGEGPWKGRLIIPCDHKQKGDKVFYSSHTIYSDDHGATWKLGGTTRDGSNECQIFERSEDALVLNMRRAGDMKEPNRAVAVSADGGMSWSRSALDRGLIGPKCQASILSCHLPRFFDRPVLAFSNPAQTSVRKGMMLRLSFDEGWAWTVTRMLHSGPAAYSCLALLPEARIACLFEAGQSHPYEGIVFTTLPLQDLVPREYGIEPGKAGD